MSENKTSYALETKSVSNCFSTIYKNKLTTHMAMLQLKYHLLNVK